MHAHIKLTEKEKNQLLLVATLIRVNAGVLVVFVLVGKTTGDIIIGCYLLACKRGHTKNQIHKYTPVPWTNKNTTCRRTRDACINRSLPVVEMRVVRQGYQFRPRGAIGGGSPQGEGLQAPNTRVILKRQQPRPSFQRLHQTYAGTNLNLGPPFGPISLCKRRHLGLF